MSSSSTRKRLGMALTALAVAFVVLLTQRPKSDDDVVVQLSSISTPVPRSIPFFERSATSAVVVSPQRDAARESGGAVTVVPSLPHPSCIAMSVVTAHVPHPPVAQGSMYQRRTPVPLPLHHEYLREYSHPEFNCFKHGGHYTPGLVRKGATAAHSVSKDAEYLRRVVLHDVYYWNGDVYAIDAAAAVRNDKTVRFAAYFPMIGGNWPQPVVDELTVRHVPAPPWGDHARVVELPTAYFQPPTDYASVYHTTVETILPMFHTLIQDNRTRLSAQGGVSVITSRPRYARYAFKETGCTKRLEQCVETVWGTMMMAVTVAASPEERRQLLSGTSSDVRRIAQAHMSAGNGVPLIYGLRSTDQQLRSAPSSAEYPFVDGVDPTTVLHIRRLLVGNPTHCEPLWGGDPMYAELLAQRHSIRGSDSSQHQVLSSAQRPASIEKAVLLEFNRSYEDCQSTLQAFREFFVEHVVESQNRLQSRSPLIVAQDTPVRIVLTSRKGDWARQLLDEDEIVALLRAHLQSRYAAGSSVRVVKFSGGLKDQLVDQLILMDTTIFIGNHGANLLNSIFLRPNAGVITMSLRNPGFYPFSLYPQWLHVRDLVAEQMCNRRVNKGKCRWNEAHNNDMYLTPGQKELLLKMVDDIVAAQQMSPRR